MAGKHVLTSMLILLVSLGFFSLAGCGESDSGGNDQLCSSNAQCVEWMGEGYVCNTLNGVCQKDDPWAEYRCTDDATCQTNFEEHWYCNMTLQRCQEGTPSSDSSDGDADLDDDGDIYEQRERDEAIEYNPDSPCNPNPCTQEHQTICRDIGGSIICECDSGYLMIENICVLDDTEMCEPNPCVGIHRTVCRPSTTGVICECDEGYEEVGTECLPYNFTDRTYCPTNTGSIAIPDHNTWTNQDGFIEIDVQVDMEDPVFIVNFIISMSGQLEGDFQDKIINLTSPSGTTVNLWNEGRESDVPAPWQMMNFLEENALGTWKIAITDTEYIPFAGSTLSKLCLDFKLEEDYSDQEWMFSEQDTYQKRGPSASAGTKEFSWWMNQIRRIDKAEFSYSWATSDSRRSQVQFTLTMPDDTIINIPNDGSASVSHDFTSQVEGNWTTGLWKLKTVNNTGEDFDMIDFRLVINEGD